MYDGQEQQSIGKRNMDQQPAVQPPVQPALNAELPSFFADVFEGDQGPMRRLRHGLTQIAEVPPDGVFRRKKLDGRDGSPILQVWVNTLVPAGLQFVSYVGACLNSGGEPDPLIGRPVEP